MRLLVFGGRKVRMRCIVFAALDELHRRIGIEKLVQGGAPGVDQDAFIWGKTHLDPRLVYTCNADWKDLSHPDAIIVQGPYGPYDKRAGMRRNAKMLEKYPPTHALQFPGGHGTAGMRGLCDKAGIPVFQVYDKPHECGQPIAPMEFWA